MHGYSLDGANKIIKKIIISCFNENYKKILVITGKGSRSQSYKNPYASQKLSILKNSVPVYIKNDYDLKSKWILNMVYREIYWNIIISRIANMDQILFLLTWKLQIGGELLFTKQVIWKNVGMEDLKVG